LINIIDQGGGGVREGGWGGGATVF
jgi:hypothetical protein